MHSSYICVSCLVIDSRDIWNEPDIINLIAFVRKRNIRLNHRVVIEEIGKMPGRQRLVKMHAYQSPRCNEPASTKSDANAS